MVFDNFWVERGFDLAFSWDNDSLDELTIEYLIKILDFYFSRKLRLLNQQIKEKELASSDEPKDINFESK